MSRSRHGVAGAGPITWRLGMMLCLAGAGLCAREAEIWTCDGKAYEGHVRMESNVVTVVNADKFYVRHILVTNLQELLFRRGQSPAPVGEPAPVETLPAPWRHRDVGVMELEGGAIFELSQFRVRSAGTNILQERDSLHFVYKPVRGNSEIVARLLQLQRTEPAAQAGLMMRTSLAPDAPNLFLGVGAGRRGIFQWRSDRGGPTQVTEHRDLYVPGWIKLKREGENLSGYRSRNGIYWSLVDRVMMPLGEEIFVGMAVASGQPGRLTRSVFDQVREAPWLGHPSFVPRVELRSGSVVVGPIESADGSALRFVGPPPRAPLPMAEVATLHFRWVPDRHRQKLRSGRPGVLLSNGEYVEAEFRGIHDGQLLLSSVLLGMRQFDLTSEVMAVVLRRSRSPVARFEVRMLDGSVWRGESLELGWNEVVLSEPAIGRCRLPIYDLLEVRRGKG